MSCLEPGLRSSIPLASSTDRGGEARRDRLRKTYWSGRFDRDLRHANIRLVEVLDSLGGDFGRLVADIANPSLGDQLDVGDFAVVCGKVFAEIRLCDVGRKTPDKYS